MRFNWVGLLLLCLSSSTWASVNVITSIKPLQLITEELTQGVSEPDVLLNSTASPHDYALKPSDIRRLKTADLVIWIGPNLEPFMAHLVEDSPTSLELSKQAHIKMQPYQEGAHEGHDELDHEHHDSEVHEHDHDEGHASHEGHVHTGLDPHIWLGPEQAQQVADVIAKKLSSIDPENKAVYQKNLQQFTAKLTENVAQIQEKLKPVQDKGYYVFHDGYSYFESYFKLNNLGHFTVSPERAPGAKTLAHIREELQEHQALCIFSEPQFKPAVIEKVVKGTDAKIGSIDPLATDIDLGAGAYFNFLQDIANSYSQCLGANS